jgi:hypothetical protein
VALTLPAIPRSNVALLVPAAAFALTMKLSTAPLLVLAIVAVWLYRRTPEVRLAGPLALAGILLGVWMLRGLMLSGCAVYPVPQSCIGLPWTVSRAQAAAELLGIRSWARVPGRIDHWNVMASGWSWVGPWIVRTLQALSTRLFVCGGVLGGAALLAGARADRLVKITLAGLGMCLLYWFSTAPDVRFGSGYLAVAGILGLSIACAAYFGGADFIGRLTIEAIAVAILIGAAALTREGNTWSIENPPAYRAMMAPGGRWIWMPQGIDQCWDHQLPCSPYFHPDALKRVRWR